MQGQAPRQPSTAPSISRLLDQLLFLRRREPLETSLRAQVLGHRVSDPLAWVAHESGAGDRVRPLHLRSRVSHLCTIAM